MDFSKAIDFDSFQFNTLNTQAGGLGSSGYLLDEIDLSDIEIAAYYEKRALRDGIDASDVYLGRRRINAIVTVFGSTQGDFWDKHQALLAAFSPTLSYSSDSANLGFLPMNFFQPTANIASWPASTYPDGIPLRYYVRPAANPAYKLRRDDLGGVAAKGLSLQVRLSLLARNPRKVTQAETTATTSTGAGYRGDYPNYVDISIVSGSATGNGRLEIGANVLSVNIDAASTTYTFYSERFAFYKGATNRDDLLYGNTTPFIFDGSEGSSVTKGGVFAPVGGAATYNFLWREAYA